MTTNNTPYGLLVYSNRAPQAASFTTQDLSDATASARRLVAALQAPGRPISLDRAFTSRAAPPAANTLKLPLPTSLAPGVILYGRRKGSLTPELESVAGQDVADVLEFQHWTRSTLDSKDSGHKGKGKAQGQGGAEESQSGAQGKTGAPDMPTIRLNKNALPASPPRRSPRKKGAAASVERERGSGLKAAGSSLQPQSLSIGAIVRCIPEPYKIVSSFSVILSDRLSTKRPDHESSIRFSFVDLATTATPQTSKCRLRPSNIRSPAPISSAPVPISQSHTLYPVAFSCLAPGRRGAWIIPIGGALPYEDVAIPIWDPPPAFPDRRRVSSGKIYWSDDRLGALWEKLRRCHDKARWGVEATCYRADSTLSGEGESGEGKKFEWPDHVRVPMEACFALGLRALLRLTKDHDGVRFLDYTKLLWVDEAGTPIFVA
ncbi:hypothetical protein P7C70_g1375, partial [Phenoliferia sp. Uapishka_3]